ncbi:M23 family metallopeptidase [Candidatus Moduliflexota bacterium]
MFFPLLALALAAAPTAPVEIPGEVGNGDLFVARPAAGAVAPDEIIFLDQTYRLIGPPGGRDAFFLVAVDLDTEPGSYDMLVRFPDGKERRVPLAVVPREYAEEHLTLDKAMVTPPEEVLERIAAERKAAAAVYRTSREKPLWAPPFRRPVEGSPSGNFGRRRILNGLPRSPHSGEDYSAPRGAGVRAVASGRVRMARDLYYSGKTLLIDHGAGLVSQYFHLDEMKVREGEAVEKGDVVGAVGSTGRVTGPHLHFGIRLHGQRVNPSLLWEIFAP